MKTKLTQIDRNFARAVQEAAPLYPAPDRAQTLAYVRAEVARREGHPEPPSPTPGTAKRNPLRKIGLVALFLGCVVVGSTLMTVLTPTDGANADNWFAQLIVSMRNVFRVQTSTGDEVVADGTGSTAVTYNSVDEALQDGYAYYLPGYLPEGYAIDKISVESNSMRSQARIIAERANETIEIFYVREARAVGELMRYPGGKEESYAWGAFHGIISESPDGMTALSCIDRGQSSALTIMGKISSEEVKKICEGLQ